MQQFLTELDAVGADLVADEHNADMLTDLGCTWAAAGEPTLLAVDQHPHRVLGFTLWGPVQTALHLRAPTCQGLGTYVIPAARRQMVATRLRAAALHVATTRGYGRVDGTAFDPRGVTAAEASGFAVVGHLMRAALTDRRAA